MDNLHLVTYNSTGLGDVQKEFIDFILENNDVDIILLQETWLFEDDISRILGGLNKNYGFAGKSGMDSTVILQGRPHGGVGILWKKNLAKSIRQVDVQSKRSCGIRLQLKNNQTVLILNVYMPTDSRSMTCADEEYEQCLDSISLCIEENSCDYVLLGGDLNVDLNRKTANLGCMLDFALQTDLLFMWDHNKCPDDTTFTAPNMTTGGSRIDHFLYSNVLHNAIIDIHILDTIKEYGHKPVSLKVSFDVLTSSTIEETLPNVSKIAWHKVDASHLEQYSDHITELIHNCAPCSDLLQCCDMACSKAEHKQSIDTLCTTIIDTCLQAGQAVFPKRKKKNPLAPNWNVKMKPFRNDCLFWGKIWRDLGKPRTGVVSDIYKSTKRNYHKAIREHKRNIKDYQKCKIGEAVSQNNHRDLWSELSKIKGKHKLSSPNIDGHTSDNDICNVFHNKYKHLYNSVASDDTHLYNLSTELENCVKQSHKTDFSASPKMIKDCLVKLKADKSDGDVGLWSNHLIYAAPALIEMVAQLFTATLKERRNATT